jgi:hypothetical protein
VQLLLQVHDGQEPLLHPQGEDTLDFLEGIIRRAPQTRRLQSMHCSGRPIPTPSRLKWPAFTCSPLALALVSSRPLNRDSGVAHGQKSVSEVADGEYVHVEGRITTVHPQPTGGATATVAGPAADLLLAPKVRAQRRVGGNQSVYRTGTMRGGVSNHPQPRSRDPPPTYSSRPRSVSGGVHPLVCGIGPNGAHQMTWWCIQKLCASLLRRTLCGLGADGRPVIMSPPTYSLRPRSAVKGGVARVRSLCAQSTSRSDTVIR